MWSDLRFSLAHHTRTAVFFVSLSQALARESSQVFLWKVTPTGRELILWGEFSHMPLVYNTLGSWGMGVQTSKGNIAEGHQQPLQWEYVLRVHFQNEQLGWTRVEAAETVSENLCALDVWLCAMCLRNALTRHSFTRRRSHDQPGITSWVTNAFALWGSLPLLPLGCQRTPGKVTEAQARCDFGSRLR